MKTIHYIKVLSIVTLTSISSILSAQEESTNYMNRELTLEREYDPSVQDANKVNTLPVVKEPEIRKIPIDYSSFTLPIDPAKEISLLSSGKLMTEMNYNNRRGYLNLAGGTYLNLNGDFGYHILNSNKDKLNVFFSHRSTNGKVKYLQSDEKIKAKLNDNLGGINFMHNFDKASFKLGAKYGYSAFNYYGMPFETILPTELSNLDTDLFITPTDRETNQVNQTIHAYTGVQSREDATTGYLVDLSYTNFSYKYGWGKNADGPTEHTIAAKFDLNKAILADQRIGISANLNYLNYNKQANTPHPAINGLYYVSNFENYLQATISPYYKAEGGNWHVHLGVNAMFYTGEEKKFMASPNVFADIEVADKTLLYAQATGELQSNSLYQLSQVNRYIDPTQGVLPTRNWLDSRIGLKSGVVPGFWFDIFGGYKICSDDFLFLPNRWYWENDFGSLYDVMNNLDSKLLFGGLQLKYSHTLFDISLKGVYNHWTINFGNDWVGGDPNTDITPYGRPKMELTAGLTLRPIDKLSVALDYYLATDRYTQLYGATEIKMNNINELNLTASYNINDTFAAYIKLDNLLFQKYELYYGYPMQKFSAMIGVNINF